MKKILKITLFIFLLIFSKLLFTYLTNEYIIFNYNKGNYKNNLIKVLKFINTNEPYIVFYNEGNIYYKTGKYEEANKNYDIALSKNPSKKRICDIRINKTLTMIKLIKSNNKDKILQDLKKSRENLYKDNCANEEDDNGKSKDAEELENEIKKMEEKLNNNTEDESNNDDNSNTNEEEISSEETDDIEQELEEIERNANKERQSDLGSLQESGNYQYYSGKRW